MPISVDLEKIPLFREALDRVRAKARRDVTIDATVRMMRSRCRHDIPEDLMARLEALSEVDLDAAFTRSIKATSIDDVFPPVPGDKSPAYYRPSMGAEPPPTASSRSGSVDNNGKGR